jgi:hypothetical protein
MYRQGLGWPFIGPRGRGERGAGARRGTTEGGAPGTRLRQGCAWASGIAVGRGDCMVLVLSGPVGQGSWWLAAGRHRRLGVPQPLPLDGTEQGREREKGRDSN